MENQRMTPGEIRRNYEAAKDKQAQIGILADMNCCTKKEIKRILFDGADSLPPLKSPYCRIGPETRKKIAAEYMAGGITQKQLAEKYGTSVVSVSNYIKKYSVTQKVSKPAPSPSKNPKASALSEDGAKALGTITHTMDRLFGAVRALLEITESHVADYEHFSITKAGNTMTCSMEQDGIILNISKCIEGAEG